MPQKVLEDIVDMSERHKVAAMVPEVSTLDSKMAELYESFSL